MTTRATGGIRVLALDMRPKRAGYALFEGFVHLLDVGVVVFRKRDDVNARLKSLLDTYRPNVLVMRSIQQNSRRSNPETRLNVRTARRSAEHRSTTIVEIRQEQLDSHFESLGASSKHQIASFLARTFPELSHRLPPKRKLWQSERARMSMFDAVSYGVVYLALLAGNKNVLDNQ